MNKMIMFLVLSIGFSKSLMASELLEGTYICERGHYVTLTPGSEVYPQPYTIIIDDSEYFGSLRVTDSNVIDFYNGGFIRIDEFGKENYVIGFTKLGDPTLYTFFGCVRFN